MNIQRFHPSTRLTPYIREFIVIESDGMTESRILPDTSMVMSFRYKGSIQRLEALSAASPSAVASTALPSAVAVTGLRRSHRIMRYSQNTGNLLVLFKEGGMIAFSRTPANELFDLTIPGDELFPKAAIQDLLGTLAEAENNEARILKVETFLTSQLKENTYDPLINEAVRQIRVSKGLVKIKDLASNLYISQDPLEKRFRVKIGSTPKQYASIIRLRNIIDTWSAYPSLTDASYEAGYFDQSHFIKDFRAFTGESPKDFFRSARFW